MEKPIRVGIYGENHPSYFEWHVRKNIRNLWELTGYPTKLYYRIEKNNRRHSPKILIKKHKFYCFFYLPMRHQKQYENILMMI